MKRIQINLDQMSTTKKIGFLASIVTICGVLFAVRSCLFGSGTGQNIKTQDLHDSPLIVASDTENITINYSVPPSETQKAIEALEAKLEQANTDIRLTRDDIKMLATALKDLDQRTSGVGKLPDGRTRIGGLVTGKPSIVIEEHNAAAHLLKEQQYEKALEHSKVAISAYESSQQDGLEIGGKLNDSQIALIYYVAAKSAHHLKMHQQAYQWAAKADNLESQIRYTGLVAACLFNLGQKPKALQTVNDRLVEDPNNLTLIKLRDELSDRIKAQHGAASDAAARRE